MSTSAACSFEHKGAHVISCRPVLQCCCCSMRQVCLCSKLPTAIGMHTAAGPEALGGHHKRDLRDLHTFTWKSQCRCHHARTPP